MFTDTVTLFNHYIDPVTQKDMWYKSIINRCMWKEQTSKTVLNNQIHIANYISLTILYRNGYLMPLEYEKSDDKANHFTFNAKNNLDIIVLGEVDEDLSESYTLINLRQDYSSIASISTVSDNTRFESLKNWKVIGK